MIKSKKLIATVLSVPMLCSLAFTNDFRAFAANEAVTTSEVATTSEATVTTVTTKTVAETTTSTTESTSSTEVTTPVEETTTEPEWDRVSNFPDENGELRFWMDDVKEDEPISIKLVYTTEDTNKPISGAQVSIYKIASLHVKNGDAKYTLIEELKKDYPELDFAGMSSEELDAIAEEFASKDLKAFAEVTTDENGMCLFEKLEPGLYLIREKAKIGMAKDYEYFKSFILNAPFPQTEDTVYNGHWLYKVETLPKTDLKGKKKLIVVPPQTGDETNEEHLRYSAIVFGLSALTSVSMLYVIVKRKKRNAKIEDENK